jgi:hypothetical protein
MEEWWRDGGRRIISSGSRFQGKFLFRTSILRARFQQFKLFFRTFTVVHSAFQYFPGHFPELPTVALADLTHNVVRLFSPTFDMLCIRLESSSCWHHVHDGTPQPGTDRRQAIDIGADVDTFAQPNSLIITHSTDSDVNGPSISRRWDFWIPQGSICYIREWSTVQSAHNRLVLPSGTTTVSPG